MNTKKDTSILLRRLALSFLLILMLMGFGGYYLLLKIQQFEQFEKQQEAIRRKHGKYTTLSLTKLAFDKCKESEHEIKLQGVMYDIAEQKIHNGEVHLKLLRDDWETEIISMLQYFSTGNQSDENTGSQSNHLLLLMKIPMIDIHAITINIIGFVESERIKHVTYSSCLAYTYLDTFSTPPDLFI